MSGAQKQLPKANGLIRRVICGSVVCLAILCCINVATSLQHNALAASATSPNCALGVGMGGTDSAATSVARGGHGCVVVQYVNNGNIEFETFNYTGADQTWTVPTGVSSVVFHVLGAGGGGGRVGSGANGGGGGYATGSYVVNPSQVFVVIVGEGGARQSPSVVATLSTDAARRNVSFGGGASGQGMSVYGDSFGSGGGRSAVRLNGAVEDLVTAGGGGGGGYSSSGGAGGGLTGQNGGASAGLGGTQTAGGATSSPEPGVAGIKYAGGYGGTVLSGNQASEGGGGGGGYFGGGGAGDNGGGGGGSSYISLLTNGSTIAGSWRQIGVQPPVNSVAPSVTGTALVAGTLTANSGTWPVAGTQSWQWQFSSDGVNFTNIVGAISGSYSPTQTGNYRVVETHSNVLTSVSSPSNSQVVQAPVVVSQPTTTTVPTTTSTITTSSNTKSTTTTSPSNSSTSTTTSSTLPNSKIPYDTSGMEKIEEGSASVAGMPKDGWVRVESSSTEYVITTSDGLRIAIAAQKDVTRSGMLNSRGMLIFEPGDEITIAGAGLMPNSPASTWMFSTPTELGQLIVASDGSFNENYQVSEDINPGDHTAQLNGIAPDGTLRVVEVNVEVVTSTPVVTPTPETPSPSAPVAPPMPTESLIGLLASALVLLAVNRRTMGNAMTLTSSLSQDGDDVEREDAGGDLASVGAGFAESEHLNRPDAFQPPAISVVDASIKKFAMRINRSSPMLARIADDGAYGRAFFGFSWLLLPIAGALLGVLSAFNTDFTVMIPALTLITAILIVGSLDAFAGFSFTIAYGISMLLGGGFSSVDSVRGFLGIAILSFAPGLVASVVRPFRRVTTGIDDVWKRMCDFVLVCLFGAWASGSMFSALPSLTTYKPVHSGRVDYVQGIVLVVLAIRWLLENSARLWTSHRLSDVEVGTFDEPSRTQQFMSYLLRTVVFVFVAIVFIGNNWALWLGTAMFLVPKIIDEFKDSFPNVPVVYRYVPRKLFRAVAMLFVALWWGTLVENHFGDSHDAILYAFVLMGIPGLVLGSIDWFARDGKKWQSTPLSKSLGVVVLIIGVLMVRGYLF